MTNNITSTMISEAILQVMNQSGGKFPIEVTQTTAANWTQFTASFMLSIVGSFFMLLVVWQGFIRPLIAESFGIGRITLKKIKKLTGRNILLVKHTSGDLFSQSMIDQSTMTKINTALTSFKGKPFDLILHTPGGMVFPSLFISRLLKDYPGQIRVLVPMYAMSGGTLLALSGTEHEIYMSPTACLGPVDPQLGNLFKSGSAESWNKIVKMKGKKADDQTISFAYTGQQYTKTIYNCICDLLSNKFNNQKERTTFAKFLTDGKVEHALPLTPIELRKWGLNIKYLDPKLTAKLIKLLSSSIYEGVHHK